MAFLSENEQINSTSADDIGDLSNAVSIESYFVHNMTLWVHIISIYG